MILILVQGRRAELVFEGPPFLYLHGKYNKSLEKPSRKRGLEERSCMEEVGGFSARNGVSM